MKKMIIGIVIVAIILISGFAFWLNTEAGKEGADDSNLALLKDLKTINMDKIPKHLKAETDLPDGRVDAQAEAYNGYAYQMASEIFQAGENSIYSPTSLYFALGVVYDGLADAMKQRMGELLGLGEETLDYYNTLYTSSVYKNNEGHALYNNIVLGNSKTKDKGIKKDFIDRIGSYYRGMIGNLNLGDAEVTKALSDFIYDNTNRSFRPKIEVDGNTKALIINTASYKAKWLSRMGVYQGDFTFTNREGKKKKTVSVHSTSQNYYESTGLVDKVRLELEDGYYLILAKPKTETYQDFSKQENLKFLLANPESMGPEIDLYVPKFEVKGKHDFLRKLIEMGYEELAAKPSFTNMFEGETTISKIIQEAKFDLNENGIEAAAYTEIDLKDAAAIEEKEVKRIEMKFDTTFVYALKNPSGAIAFIGVYEKVE